MIRWSRRLVLGDTIDLEVDRDGRVVLPSRHVRFGPSPVPPTDRGYVIDTGANQCAVGIATLSAAVAAMDGIDARDAQQQAGTGFQYLARFNRDAKPVPGSDRPADLLDSWGAFVIKPVFGPTDLRGRWVLGKDRVPVRIGRFGPSESKEFLVEEIDLVCGLNCRILGMPFLSRLRLILRRRGRVSLLGL